MAIELPTKPFPIIVSFVIFFGTIGMLFGALLFAKNVQNISQNTEDTATVEAYGTGELQQVRYGQVLVYTFEVDGEVYEIAGKAVYPNSSLPSVEWAKDQTAEVRYIIGEPNKAKVFEAGAKG